MSLAALQAGLLLPWVRCLPDSLCEPRPVLPALPTPALGIWRPHGEVGPAGGQARRGNADKGLTGPSCWLGAGWGRGGGGRAGQELRPRPAGCLEAACEPCSQVPSRCACPRRCFSLDSEPDPSFLGPLWAVGMVTLPGLQVPWGQGLHSENGHSAL